MKIFLKVFCSSFAVLVASGVQAGVIDFIKLTESAGGYGESAWNPLALSSEGVNLSITGHANNDNDPLQYAYLDWGRAGLGVCKDLIAGASANVTAPGSGANKCNPGNDDNVTVGEHLSFVFDKDVVIKNIWFNNNHDGGLGAGDQALIQGSAYDIRTGYAGGKNGVGSFSVSAGTAFDIAYKTEEFYVSAIEFTKVPEPGSAALFALGLFSLISIRCKTRA